MIKTFLGFIGVCLLCAVTYAEPVALKKNHPDQHVVVKGDTLWDISATFLEDPWLWPEIWHINTQIENPHLIYPGDIIKLIYIDKEPKLTLQRGSKNVEVLQDGTIKLSPKARVSPIDSVIPAIPLDAVQSFLVDNRVVDKEDMEDVPYVLAGGEQRILMGVNDKFYARGDFTEKHSAYGVFRPGDAYIDPDTGEILGYQALDLGLAKMVDTEGDIATLELLRTTQDIRIGDKLLPTEERKVDSVFFPKSPDVEIEGKIIHVFGGVRNVSQYNVVVINRGERDEVGVGDVMAIYRQGEQVRDQMTDELIQLPMERSGLLIVFRTFEKVSFGLVLKAKRQMQILDVVRNP